VLAAYANKLNHAEAKSSACLYSHCQLFKCLKIQVDARIGKKLPLRLGNFVLDSGQASTSRFTSRFVSMWFACSACCSMAVKPGQNTDTRKKAQHVPFPLPTIHPRCLLAWLYTKYYNYGEKWCSRYTVFSLHKIYPLRWSGHVCRMEDGRLPKDILYGQLPSAPRPVGRPKLHYKDVLKRHLKALNINTENWEQLTLERAPWRSLLQDRRAYSIQTYIAGCSRRWIDRRTRRERQ